MTLNGAIIAFCLQYAISCSPDNVAKAVMAHIGAPYDQITWCCGTLFSNGEAPTEWELEKPHTRLCSGDDINGRDPAWKDGIGSIYMGHKYSPDYKNYCAIWLHRGEPLID